MTTPIKYRISSTATKPVSDTVKGAPLTSLEIDGNFRSIKDSIELIQSAYLPAGYSAPVEYVAGVVLSSATQTVAYQGEVYAPVAAEVPFTTSGTFEVAKFVQIQSVAGVDLAATDGASLVGYDGGTVQDVLDGAKSLQDYAALRAYTGRATRIYITGLLVTAKPAGIAGVFQYDSTDTTSTDNGGTIIVGADGRRWKRDYSGYLNAKWFGAVGNGYDNDTTPIQNAINSVPSGGATVLLPYGSYLITEKLTQTKRVRLIGEGIGEQPGEVGMTRIIKASSMNTDAIELSVAGSVIEQIEFYGNIGNAGNGIYVHAGRCALSDVAVWNMGGIGIRIGNSVDAVNCNLWSMHRVLVRGCGSHGIFIENNSTGAADANSGLGSLIESSLNGGDGLRVGNAYWCVFNIITTQLNVGYGVNFTSLSKYNTFIGGDTNESNVVGQVINSGLGNSFFGPMITGFTDSGTFTTIVGDRIAKMYQGQFANYAKGYVIGAGVTPYTIIAENASGSNNGRGVGILLRPPAGSDTARDGGQIASEQETTSKDYMRFNVNNAGTMQEMLRLSPNLAGVHPGTSDNLYSLGNGARRWSVLYAGTGTINTSDEREKQDVEPLDEAERRVAIALKALVKKFRFRDAVLQKGADARFHIGVIAQDVKAAFEAEGLNPFAYALLCYDEWPELQEVVDEWGDEYDDAGNLIRQAGSQIVQEYRPAGNRYGVRYEEVLAFIIAVL